MNENNESGNDPRECGWLGCGHPRCEPYCDGVPIEDFNTYTLVRAMRGVLSADDYDELRDS